MRTCLIARPKWTVGKRLSIELARFGRMTVSLGVLQCGSCERLKAGVHATALGLAALMGLYNAAAWLSRRQVHLAINTVLYAALTAWEQKHVSHHLAELRRPCAGADATPTDTGSGDKADTAAAA